MFKLDVQGICQTCCKKAIEVEVIRCSCCQFYFHAICDSESGITDYIAKKTHLGLHKGASTKSNFIWRCDTCLTISEANEAASLKDVMRGLIDRFSQLEGKLVSEIKIQVAEEFKKLTASQSQEFDKLSTKVPEPKQQNQTVWNNPTSVENLKASLLIKADGNGRPVDADKVTKMVMDHGVPVNKVVVTSTGDTFMNFPNVESLDKIRPLLEQSDNEVVTLKKKLPSVNLLGVTEEFTQEQIKSGICSQNKVVGDLVKAGQELSVIYTREPPQGKDYYHVTVRVSPDIRSAIKSSGNKLFLSKKVCNVVDNFDVKRCNKCQEFGHYASKCAEDKPDVCGYCGENHKSNTCLLKDSPTHTHKCCNCEGAALKAEGHNTFWKKCAAYKIQQDKLKSSIAYDYSN